MGCPPTSPSATRADVAEAGREAGRMGGEADKPVAGAGREVEGVPPRQQCFLGEDEVEVIS